MKSTSEAAGFDLAMNMARQSLYRFAALSLVDPRAGSWEQLTGLRDDPLLPEAAALIRNLPQAQPAELGMGECPIEMLDPRLVLDSLPDSEHALNTQFETTFGLLVSSPCPPYETEYIDSKFTFQRSNSLADISGFYQAFGLTITDRHPERPDHVVLELEFMASLLQLERQAANQDSVRREEHQQVCRDAETLFLKEHLAWWVPAFAKLLSHEGRGGFYEAVGAFLGALIPAERALLHVDIQSCPVSPSSLERPEACEGCQFAT